MPEGVPKGTDPELGRKKCGKKVKRKLRALIFRRMAKLPKKRYRMAPPFDPKVN